MTAKLQMALFLSLIAISAVLFYHQLVPVFTISLAFAVTYISDSIFIHFRKIKPFPLEAAIVSGLIIGLLIAPTLPWYFVATAATFAMASKNFIRYNNRHIFNPAGFGLLLTSLLFHFDISWWGVSFQILHFSIPAIIFFLILLSPGFVSIIRLQRYPIVLSFWVTYAILLWLIKINISLDPTVLFFSIVMLPEPMTTPNYPNRQLVFGPFVAIVSVISGSLIFGLLVGNLVFYLLNLLINQINMNHEK